MPPLDGGSGKELALDGGSGKEQTLAGRPLLLVSACLCARPCRYDGGSFDLPLVRALEGRGLLLPVCPEVLGGLPVPRPPCEIQDGRVLERSGADRGAAFAKGAELTLAIALSHNIGAAMLKDKSPSCGSRFIYDGTFSRRLIPGQGVAAALLKARGIRLFAEDELEAALEFVLGT